MDRISSAHVFDQHGGDHELASYGSLGTLGFNAAVIGTRPKSRGRRIDKAAQRSRQRGGSSAATGPAFGGGGARNEIYHPLDAGRPGQAARPAQLSLGPTTPQQDALERMLRTQSLAKADTRRDTGNETEESEATRLHGAKPRPASSRREGPATVSFGAGMAVGVGPSVEVPGEMSNDELVHSLVATSPSALAALAQRDREGAATNLVMPPTTPIRGGRTAAGHSQDAGRPSSSRSRTRRTPRRGHGPTLATGPQQPSASLQSGAVGGPSHFVSLEDGSATEPFGLDERRRRGVLPAKLRTVPQDGPRHAVGTTRTGVVNLQRDRPGTPASRRRSRPQTRSPPRNVAAARARTAPHHLMGTGLGSLSGGPSSTVQSAAGVSTFSHADNALSRPSSKFGPRLQASGSLMERPVLPEMSAIGWDWNDAERSMLGEWLDSYDRERASFSSAIVESELKLSQAVVLAEELATPNALTTAVAFRMLDNVSHLFGRYNGLLSIVSRALRQAVYVDPPEGAANVPEEYDSVDDEVAATRAGVKAYFGCVPYFAKALGLQREKQNLMRLTEQLKRMVEQVTQQLNPDDEGPGGAGGGKGNRDGGTLWRKLRLSEMIGKLNTASRVISRLTVTKRAPHQMVLAEFARLSPVDQSLVLRTIVTNASDFIWAELFEHLMEVVPADELSMMLPKAVHETSGLKVAHLRRVVMGLCDDLRLTSAPQELVAAFMHSFSNMSPETQMTMLRHAAHEAPELFTRVAVETPELDVIRRSEASKVAQDDVDGSEETKNEADDVARKRRKKRRKRKQEESQEGDKPADDAPRADSERMNSYADYADNDEWQAVVDPVTGQITLVNDITGEIRVASGSVAMAAASAVGAQDWEQEIDPVTGDTVWVNCKTGERVQDTPAEVVAAAAAARAAEWVEVVDPVSGEKVWKNVRTGDQSAHTPAAIAEATSAAANVAAGAWEETVDPETGKIVWVHSATGESQEVMPQEVAAARAAEAAAEANDWDKRVDPETGDVFWTNLATGETTHDPPAVVKRKEAAMAQADASKWVERIDPATGETTFVDVSTGESTQPGQVPEAVARARAAEAAAQAAAATEDAAVWIKSTDPDSGQAIWTNRRTGEIQHTEPQAVVEATVLVAAAEAAQWQEVTDPDTGEVISWVNATTGEVADAADGPPAEVLAAEEAKAVADAGAWVQKIDKRTGKTVWYNSETGKVHSKGDPPEVAAAKAAKKKTQAAKGTAVSRRKVKKLSAKAKAHVSEGLQALAKHGGGPEAFKKLTKQQRRAMAQALFNECEPAEICKLHTDYCNGRCAMSLKAAQAGRSASGGIGAVGGAGSGVGSGYGANSPTGMGATSGAQVQSSWNKYLGKPARGVTKQKAKTSLVLSLVYECYEKKMVADMAEDRTADKTGALLRRRQPLPDFIRDFLLHKFGLPSMADGHLFGVVDCIRKHAAGSHRLRLFGMLCGVLGPPLATGPYNPRLCDMVLNVLHTLWPKFSSATLRARKERFCFVPLSSAMAAVETVFPAESCSFSLDRRQLTGPRREQLRNRVRDMATQYEMAVARAKSHQVDRTHATMETLNIAQREGITPGADLSATGLDGGVAPTLGGAADGEGRGPSRGEFESFEIVVDVDELLDACVEFWYLQVNEDMEDLGRQYDACDADKNGVLSYQEFAALLQSCTEQKIATRESLEVFKALSRIDGESDTVTRNAFATVCAQFGVTPLRGPAASANPTKRASAVSADAAEQAAAASAAIAADVVSSNGSSGRLKRPGRRRGGPAP